MNLSESARMNLIVALGLEAAFLAGPPAYDLYTSSLGRCIQL